MDNPPDFVVVIVESPSSADLLDGRTEGTVLREVLRLSGTAVSYNLVTNEHTLLQALGERAAEALAPKRHAVPIVHLSCHGNSDGIQLTDGTIVSWETLRDLLKPINQAMNGLLVVCMSSCHGVSGWRMAMTRDLDLPFFALVGHPDRLRWNDGAVGFAAFYHRLQDGTNLFEAVQAMRVASGDDRFLVDLGKALRDNWVEYLNENEPKMIQEALQRALRATPHDQESGPA